jgi:hypothetical protein
MDDVEAWGQKIKKSAVKTIRTRATAVDLFGRSVLSLVESDGRRVSNGVLTAPSPSVEDAKIRMQYMIQALEAVRDASNTQDVYDRSLLDDALTRGRAWLGENAN